MSDFNRFYKELNKEQKDAVDMLEGPLLVIAGPGTGKTQLLSVRAANIIRNKKSNPENILVLTYTNAAAKAMKERLSSIIGIKGYDIEVCTFHAFCNSIILDSEEAANYLQDRIQITDIEKIKAIEYILDHTKGLGDIRPFNAPYIYVREIESKIGELKREGVAPKEFLDHCKDVKPDGIYVEDRHILKIKALSIVYDQYELLKEGRNKDVFDVRGRYDFDDMILLAATSLQNEKTLKKRYQERFSYIMVDEFQDTNGAQLKFLFSLLKGKSPNLCCVGDDDQSIYRFQGASIGNFKELKDRFPDLKAIYLKNNYRSTKEILGLSQHLIKELPKDERVGDKDLVPVKEFEKKSIEFHEFTRAEEELCFLVDKVKELKKEIEHSKTLTKEERSNPYNNIAILVRKRASILNIVDKFLQVGIPYATDGNEDISSEFRVRQMLDLIELCSLSPDNYEDRGRILYKVLISDYLGIPYKDTLSFINSVNKKKRNKEGVTLVSEFFEEKDTPSSFKKIRPLVKRLLEEAPFKPLHTVLMEYIRDAGVFKYILEKYDKEEVVKIRELRALCSFINMVKETDISKPGVSLKDFVEDLRTRTEHNMPLKGSLVTMTQNGVRIITAHSSKGEEFYGVIIPFCLQDKNWPLKPRPALIPLPPDILKTREKASDKEKIKALQYYDETRLFYVAISRAESSVIFTSSPQENQISSSFLHHLGLRSEVKDYKEEEVLLRSLESTKAQDPFIGTEDILKDIVKDMALNPTSINNYLYCRRKFLYDNVLMLPGSKKQSLIFGNSVHAALEHLYRAYMKTNRFPDFKFFKDRFIEALKFQGPEKGMELRLIEQFEGLKRFYDKCSKDPVRPLGLENRMPINIDGIVFTGKYDKLELENEKNKAVKVVDYKTGQPKKHAKGIYKFKDLEDEGCDGYLRQLVCYKLLYEKDNTREDKDLFVSHGVLVFVEPAKDDGRNFGIKKSEPTEFKVELTEDMVSRMVSIIKDVWQGIQGLHFEKLPERDSKKCAWCDFDYICWKQEGIL
ncbi:MAG: ATP-dependent DNA helicase [Candidatus Omnitrophota bacterium]